MRNDSPNSPVPKIVSTQYGPVEYAEYGDGPAVVAVHGAMGGYDQSLLLARTIGAAGYRYIGVSRPGYLGTPLASGKTSEQQADLCAALLDTLGIPSAIMMAVSGGGPCALQFALRHRQRCRALVLISTCGQQMDEPIPFSFRIMALLMRVPAIARAMEEKARQASPEQAAIRSIPDPELRARTLQDPEVGPLFTELLTSTADRMTQRMPGTMNDIAITRGTAYPLEQIAVPTLVVHGTQDGVVSYKHAMALSSRIPGAELLTIEGGDHVAIFTHRQQVTPRVAHFLQAHTGDAVAMA